MFWGFTLKTYPVCGHIALICMCSSVLALQYIRGTPMYNHTNKRLRFK